MTAKELGNLPVSPCEIRYSGDGKPILIQTGSDSILESGLTKRELFAYGAMKGFTSNDGWAKTVNPDDWDEYAERLADASVKIADALLEKLAKE